MTLLKKLFLPLFFLLPCLAMAQGPSSAQVEAAKGQVKLFPTASLPSACPPGMRVYDITADASVVCKNDGTTWASIGGTGGSGTAGKLAKWTAATTLGDSLLSDDGTNVTLGSGGLIFGTTSGLYNPSANTLALRNGPNAQAIRVFNNYTDASNGEWATLDWTTAANVLTFGTKKNGSGTQRSLQIDGASIDFQTAGTTRWSIYGTGDMKANVDNTYDIGASGANRPRILYVGTQASISTTVIGQDVVIGNGRSFYWSTRGGVSAGADGVFTWTDNAGTSFGRFNLGGTTSSYPALKRNGAGIDFRLADDSAYAGIAASTGSFNGNVTFGTDNTYDIGASGANRPRNGYFGGSLITGADLILGAGGSYVRSSTNGVILLGNASLTDFGRLQLGGTTSSFPAIKRNGAGINFRLADDSADTYALQSGIYGSLYETGGSTAITITTAGTYYQWVNSTAGACTNMTCATATDDITATIAGKYRVTAVTSFVSGTNNETITGRIFNEGSGQTQCTGAKKLATAANMNDISISCIVTMAVNDSLTLQFTSTSSSTSVTPSEVNISASYLGN